MNKKSVLWLLLELVFLIVFNTLFFVIGGTSYPASSWIAYAFIHFAYFMVLLTPALVREGSNFHLFSFSIYAVSSAYFFVELIVGALFIIIKQDSYKASLIVQMVIAAVYAVILIANLLANEDTADNVERHEAEVKYIKDAAAKVKLLVGQMKDKKSDKEISRAYDALHASPTKSSEAVKSIEEGIMSSIDKLSAAVSAQNAENVHNAVTEILSLVDERNKKLIH